MSASDPRTERGTDTRTGSSPERGELRPDRRGEVGPRHAIGNRGWNEPSDEQPQTLEAAVRAGPDRPRDADPLAHGDRDAMVPAEPGTLAGQRPLLDDEGDDIREYTGEPIETDEGWVAPQTQNRGGSG